MEHASGDDRGRVGSTVNCLSADEGLKINWLRWITRDAKSLLQFSPAVGLRKKQSCGFGPLLLQSLQDEDAAMSVL